MANIVLVSAYNSASPVASVSSAQSFNSWTPVSSSISFTSGGKAAIGGAGLLGDLTFHPTRGGFGVVGSLISKQGDKVPDNFTRIPYVVTSNSASPVAAVVSSQAFNSWTPIATSISFTSGGKAAIGGAGLLGDLTFHPTRGGFGVVGSLINKYGELLVTSVNVLTQRQITGIARIQSSAVNQTITGKAAVRNTTSQTITSQSRITGFANRAITGKASVRNTTTQTITGIARLMQGVQQMLTGVARVTATVNRTISGKAAVQNTTTQSITGIARLMQGVQQTITGQSRVTSTVDQTISGKAAVQNTTTRDVTGVARMMRGVAQPITGIARVTATTNRTITGKAAVQNTATQTITGVGSISHTHSQEISGLAAVQNTATRTLTGRTRLQITSPRTVTGVAHVVAAEGTFQSYCSVVLPIPLQARVVCTFVGEIGGASTDFSCTVKVALQQISGFFSCQVHVAIPTTSPAEGTFQCKVKVIMAGLVTREGCVTGNATSPPTSAALMF